SPATASERSPVTSPQPSPVNRPTEDREIEGLVAKAHRINCSNNLRMIGFAMLSFEQANAGFPSDQRADYAGQFPSFYAQILDDMELSNLAPNGQVNPKGVAKPYVCPGRRLASQVPGAADYGYVATSASGASILDHPKGVEYKAI